MLLNCPICNKILKERGDQIAGGLYSITCYECGAFGIEVDLSQIMRRKYLSFNLDTAMGRESYEENIKIFREFIQSAVNGMIFLRRP
jgi:hypothetical protein